MGRLRGGRPCSVMDLSHVSEPAVGLVALTGAVHPAERRLGALVLPMPGLAAIVAAPPLGALGVRVVRVTALLAPGVPVLARRHRAAAAAPRGDGVLERLPALRAGQCLVPQAARDRRRRRRHRRRRRRRRGARLGRRHWPWGRWGRRRGGAGQHGAFVERGGNHRGGREKKSGSFYKKQIYLLCSRLYKISMLLENKKKPKSNKQCKQLTSPPKKGVDKHHMFKVRITKKCTWLLLSYLPKLHAWQVLQGATDVQQSVFHEKSKSSSWNKLQVY